MALLLSNSLILHIPKTGSSWVRAACREAVRGPVEEVGVWHQTLWDCQRVLPALPLTATFVRHPLDWYVAAWSYWRNRGQFVRPPNGPVVEDDDFETTVRNCMAAEPRGYVSCVYERYVGEKEDELDFVGRQESLVDDLVRILKMANEDFDEQRLRDTRPINVHARRTDASKSLYSPELAQEVMQHEHRAMGRFGYSANSEFYRAAATSA